MIEYLESMHLLLSKSTLSLRRTIPVPCSIALAWGELVGLSPLSGVASVLVEGTTFALARAEAPNAPSVVCLSFGLDQMGTLLSDLESINLYP